MQWPSENNTYLIPTTVTVAEFSQAAIEYSNQPDTS
jgi:hypothetical protein